jgi:hypothetical protein
MLGLMGYSWFAILAPEQQQKDQQERLLAADFPEGLQSLHFTSDISEFHIEQREGVWWVVQPKEYLANQEFIEKSLQIMGDSESHHHFALKEDRYGLNPGRAFYRLRFGNGQEQRLKVGSQEGPADTLYVLDQDQEHIFVVHNIWGQFLYYPTKRLYTPNLPILGSTVKRLNLKKENEVVWSVEPVSATHLVFSWQGQRQEVPKAHGLWFFKKIREFPVPDIEFGNPTDFTPYWVLQIETDQGNIIFEFDEKMQTIRVPRFTIYGPVDPYSLKSLGEEVERVFSSD